MAEVRTRVQQALSRDVPFYNTSVVISRPWSRDLSALEFILSRSRSWSRDLKKGLDNNTVQHQQHHPFSALTLLVG